MVLLIYMCKQKGEGALLFFFEGGKKTSNRAAYFKIKIGRVLFISLILGVLFYLPTGAYAQERLVLLLHSYHKGFPWSDGISRGVLNTFLQSDINTRVFIEYLDAKRSSPKRYTFFLENTLRLKYQKRTPDVVICSDDDAYTFMRHAGRRIFPHVPVVFCGVNSRDSLPVEIDSLTTGVIEKLDIKGTMNLALKMFPSTENVVVICDLSSTGMWVINQLREEMRFFKDKINEIDLIGLPHESLATELQKLPPQTIIFLLIYFQDGEGHFFPTDETIAFIQKETSFPIFSVWEMMVGNGAIGGSVLRAEHHGKQAAELAIEILKGKAPASIPIGEDIPVFMANYSELRQQNISIRSLPRKTILLGEPETFFYRYRRIIGINIAIIIILAMLVPALYFNDKLLKKEISELRKETEHLEKLFENSPHGTILTNAKGEILRANRAFLRMFGYGRDEVKGKEIDFLLTKGGTLQQHAQNLTRITTLGGVISENETSRVCKDGNVIPVSISGFPLMINGVYRGSYGIYTDISSRKENENIIRKHLKSEEIISSFSAQLVKGQEVENVIYTSLHELRLFLNARYMAIFLFSGSEYEDGRAYVRHEREKEKDSFFTLSFDETEPLRRTLKSQPFLSLDDSPFTWNTSEKNAILLPRKNETMVLFPLLKEGITAGCICSVFVRNNENEHIIEGLLGIYSHLLSSAFLRNETEKVLKKNIQLLSKTFEETFHLMSRLLEIKDPYTADHQQKVALLARRIAEKMNLTEEQITAVYYAALVHDIGKIPIPSSILSKPGRLNEAEFTIIQNHVNLGTNILSAIDFPWPIADIVRQHHEHIDGTGYPRRLKGDEISIEARIICVADVVEAMSSFRPYRPALGIEEALEEIQKKRNIWFDSRVVDACLSIFEETNGVFWDKI